MTEAEWETSTDPLVILERLRVASQEDFYPAPTQRKDRLFAVACCRHAVGSLRIGRIDPLDVAENHAEGTANEDELQLLRSRLKQLIRPYRISVLPLIEMLLSEAFPALRLIDESFRFIPNCTATSPQMLTPIARDIFGNPFRPVTVVPSWLTSDVLSLLPASTPRKPLTAFRFWLMRYRMPGAPTTTF
jgi:hypothetical protein